MKFQHTEGRTCYTPPLASRDSLPPIVSETHVIPRGVRYVCHRRGEVDSDAGLRADAELGRQPAVRLRQLGGARSGARFGVVLGCERHKSKSPLAAKPPNSPGRTRLPPRVSSDVIWQTTTIGALMFFDLFQLQRMPSYSIHARNKLTSALHAQVEHCWLILAAMVLLVGDAAGQQYEAITLCDWTLVGYMNLTGEATINLEAGDQLELRINNDPDEGGNLTTLNVALTNGWNRSLVGEDYEATTFTFSSARTLTLTARLEGWDYGDIANVTAIRHRLLPPDIRVVSLSRTNPGGLMATIATHNMAPDVEFLVEFRMRGPNGDRTIATYEGGAAPEQTFTMNTVLFHESCLAGDYEILFVVDRHNAVPEAVETNNGANISLPDYVVSNLHWTEDGRGLSFQVQTLGDKAPYNQNPRWEIRHIYVDDDVPWSMDFFWENLGPVIASGAIPKDPSPEPVRIEVPRLRPPLMRVSPQPTHLALIADMDMGGHGAVREISESNNYALINLPQVSWELSHAPYAETTDERVGLWLQRNKMKIRRAAQRYNVSPIAIAGAIMWEGRRTSQFFSRGLGPGKLHPSPSAYFIECQGWLRDRSDQATRRALRSDTGAINYIAVLMHAYCCEAERPSPPFWIRDNHGVLGTLYQGSEAGNIVQCAQENYFETRVRAEGREPTVDPDPVQMGQWIVDHESEIRSWLGSAGNWHPVPGRVVRRHHPATCTASDF